MDQDPWKVADPENREDLLPQPYRFLHEILCETVLHQLSLAMHQIEEKKKDNNYEGTTKEYHAYQLIQLENISCLSSHQKEYNHLVVGDKAGSIYLLDLAKKTVFSKRELFPGKRVIHIHQSVALDAENKITTITVTLNAHPIIYVLRYRHSELKIVLVHEIEVTTSNEVGELPFESELVDYARMLVVKTYKGSMVGYKLPELLIDTQSCKNTQGIKMEKEDYKKILRYPLDLAKLDNEPTKISVRAFEINFAGYKSPIKYKDLISKLKKQQKQPVKEPEPAKKDTKKADKKPQKVQPEQKEPAKETIHYNCPPDARQPLLQNGLDNTESYQTPKFHPFLYFLKGSCLLPKNKYFERGKVVPLVQRIVYGWTNTKEFVVQELRQVTTEMVPHYEQIAYFQEPIQPQKLTKDQNSLQEAIELGNMTKLKLIFPITCSCLSSPDVLLAFGMTDGTVSVWNTKTLTLQFNADKHGSAVTALGFFECWKMVSGSKTNQVYVTNLQNKSNEMKKTNIFEAKENIAISSITVNGLGLATVLDQRANMRIYDLWRNEKIAKMQASTNFAMVESDDIKRFISAGSIQPTAVLYSNYDYTIILSTSWCNPSRAEDLSVEETQKLSSLQRNPWLNKDTYIHVFRNFQFLISLFEGLENTYKKGYERKKIENLFTNLEFAQLNDRNFDIPDFGHSPPKKESKFKESTFSRSSFQSKNKSQDKKMSQSGMSQAGKSQAGSGIKTKLTSELLHPQKFLLERRKIPKSEIVTEDGLINALRQQHQQKIRRENILQNDISKSLL